MMYCHRLCILADLVVGVFLNQEHVKMQRIHSLTVVFIAFSDLTAEQQRALQFSRALQGPNEKQKFSIDWLTLKAMFTHLTPEEQETLGE